MPQKAEVHKNYVKVHRIAKTLNVSPEGLVEDEQGFYYKELKAGLKGQRWYPGRNGYHPSNCVCGINHQPIPQSIS